jgi:hypothetical protein
MASPPAPTEYIAAALGSFHLLFQIGRLGSEIPLAKW